MTLHFEQTADRILVAFIGAAFLAALSGLSCGAEMNIHQTQEALSNECIHCHSAAFAATVNPKHEGLFEETCQDCHSTDGAWVPVPDLHELSAIKSSPCTGCHQDEFDNAKNPVHKGIYPTTCADCHSTEKFVPTTTDIHSTAFFATKVCFDCHAADYTGAKSFDHVATNTAKTCETCHTTGGAWKPLKGG